MSILPASREQQFKVEVLGYGMLWRDDDPKSDLETKIRKAIKYFEEKYSLPVTTVELNTRTLGSVEKPEIDGVTIKIDDKQSNHHFIISSEKKLTI